jgi:hypothetical protein
MGVMLMLLVKITMVNFTGYSYPDANQRNAGKIFRSYENSKKKDLTQYHRKMSRSRGGERTTEAKETSRMSNLELTGQSFWTLRCFCTAAKPETTASNFCICSSLKQSNLIALLIESHQYKTS